MQLIKMQETKEIEVADQNATETGNLTQDDLLNFISKESTEEEAPNPTEYLGEEEAKSEDVLSQSNISESEESEEDNEAESVEETEDAEDSDESEEVEEATQPKSIQKLLKQIARLTARSKGSEEQVEALRAQVDSLKLDAKAEKSNPTIDEIQSYDELETLRKEALSAKKWARSHEDESYVQEGDTEYTREEIKKIRDNAEEHLEELIPERKKFLEQRMASDNLLIKDFPFVKKKDSESYNLFQKLQADPLLQSLNKLPNGNYLKALLVEGVTTLQRRKGTGSRPKIARKTPPPPTEPLGDVSPPTQRANTDKEKRKVLGDSNISEEQLTAFLSQY